MHPDILAGLTDALDTGVTRRRGMRATVTGLAAAFAATGGVMAKDKQGNQIDFGGFQDHSVKGGDDVLTLGYIELIAPLIKAVQEQQAQIGSQQSAMAAQQEQIDALLVRLAALEPEA
jgi:hypothetical protein